MIRNQISLAVLALLLAGCAALPLPAAAPQESAGAPVAAEALPSPTAAASPNAAPEIPPDDPAVLRLWVPPQFDPAADTPAARLLQQRLEEFTARRPGIQIEVRVKAEDGPGGMFESLAAASTAAQLAIPDLVALNHPQIQAAAQQGLVRSLDGMTGALDNPDWYGFARQLALVQESVFGLPFAGDAMAQVYWPAELEKPAAAWAEAVQAAVPLAFPAADPHAHFSLALYQAGGGPIYDEGGTGAGGSAALAEEPLRRVLDFYQQGLAAGSLPDWLTQLQSDEQAWQAFIEHRTPVVATWASRYLNARRPPALVGELGIEQLPTPDGKPFTTAGGWAWALSAQDAEKRELAVQLAEFLTESDFLARWSEAAGYLPARPSALAAWRRQESLLSLDQIASSAVLAPLPDAIDSLGPRVQNAVLQVLKRELEAAAAARAAVATELP